MLDHRLAIRLALVIGLGLGWVVRAAADEPDNKKPTAEDKDIAKEETPDRYALPEGGVKELLKFFNELRRPGSTRQEIAEYRSKAVPAMKAAALKIQQLATKEDQNLEGYNDAIGMWLMLRVEE